MRELTWSKNPSKVENASPSICSLGFGMLMDNL
jgi:hypothetical protein